MARAAKNSWAPGQARGDGVFEADLNLRVQGTRCPAGVKGQRPFVHIRQRKRATTSR
jgi:hypothetical protein